MKIISSQSATLTNHEVLSHILKLSPPSSAHPPPTTTINNSISSQQQQPLQPPPPVATATSKPLKSPNYETVLKELKDYLTPSSPSGSTSSPMPPHFRRTTTIAQLTKGLSPYHLTKGEVLMLANLMPRDLGFLDCVIEECDERFSAEEQEGILGVVEGVIAGEGEEGEAVARGR
ncbi:MAG: hypothetical protein MMC33_004117 [Icmadophila ericetorum]|nr:hypothetical protein [Icmadophila ericetorum]